jgi:Icc-related predicted phosphoesterase
MRFIYACDVHGDKDKYYKLIAICKERKIQNIVLGGDIILKKCDREKDQPVYLREFMDPYFNMLKNNNINCICILGNDDLEILDEEYEEICRKYSNVYSVDNKALIFEDICFIGCGKVLDGPWQRKSRVVVEKETPMEEQFYETVKVDKCTREISAKEWEEYRKNYETMEEALAKLPENNTELKTIYILHDPPYGIGLDVCFNGYEAGSKTIANFLRNSNAYMSLHGHIHESPNMSNKWYNTLENTICIQPGQTEIGEDDINYVVIDTDENTYERIVEKI